MHYIYKNSLVLKDISPVEFGIEALAIGIDNCTAIKFPEKCCFNRRRHSRIGELLDVVSGKLISFPLPPLCPLRGVLKGFQLPLSLSNGMHEYIAFSPIKQNA